MRNEEAARYARRSAMAAGAIVLIVAGVYTYRAFERFRAKMNLPAMVSAAIQQASANFTYSDVEQGRTVFTVRASRATQFKEQNRAILEDVWITVYGRDGKRNDNIHTRECSYQPLSGAIRCAGEVRIDLQSAAAPGKAAAGEPADSFHATTSDLSFNRTTGEASTSQPVEFHFAAGQGYGVGVSYSTSDSILRVQHDIRFDLNASDRTGGLPVSATGSNLEIRRSDRVVVLGGPAVVKAGSRELTADTISVNLDENFDAQSAVAQGHAEARGNEGGRKMDVTADKFETLLSPDGWVKCLSADGQIAGTQQTSAGKQTFSASHVEFAMFPERNLPKEMTASGGVSAESLQNGASQRLKTAALRVRFSAPSETKAKVQQAKEAQQRIESAETLAPATIESKNGNESAMLRAQKFVAKMDGGGRLGQLVGQGGVEIQRQVGDGKPEVSSASDLAATFGTDGQWSEIDESGNVRFEQEGSHASAAHAHMVRATGEIVLEGSPVVSDAVSRTTAAEMKVNQTSGDLRATGGVSSTYMPATQSDAMSLGSGPAHVTADALTGSTATGHVVYEGHARLWQGESVLNADQIEVWRDDKKMQASGHVFAIFPQGSGPNAVPIPAAGGKSPGTRSGSALWNVRAPLLTYWGDEGKARLEGGVLASSQDESLESRTLDLFLGPAGSTSGSAEKGVEGVSASAHASAAAELGGGRQLTRVLAQGDVIVRQGDRRGTAEQAEYTAADGKFVLSGGAPTLTNSSRDTTSGHSLTFFVANDTILIDSQTGSRTLTKHRVEK